MKGIGIMRKFISTILCAAILTPAVVLPAYAADNENTEEISYNYVYDIATGYTSDNTYTRKMEKLTRGLVAINTDSGVYLSWRLFDSEDTRYGSADSNVDFNIYRDGSLIDTVSDTTNYTDTTVGTSYAVAPVIDGVEGEKCEAVSVMSDSYFDIPLDVPEDETIYDTSGNELYTASFFPADCSTGDVDGDGEYEIIIKWTSMEKDVGSPGTPAYSGTVRLAAYKLDGTKLWDNDINLGRNIYSSAHTVQFLVYDFDLDGKAEVMCQTSLGSKDAKGIYVSHSAKDDAAVVSTGAKIVEFTDEQNESADYRNAGWGLITTGEEFLTVFSGETGEAIDTIDLPTARGNVLDWGDANDTAGNRVNRFIADVAYLDGEKPYAVYLRGYYFGKDNNGRQRTSIAGISFDGERLSADYRFDTKSGQPGYYEGAYQYVGQGNHNCTVADVDNDGKDEFITGALCMQVDDNNEFKPKWCTYLQHGDALHIGDYDPTITGLEFFTVHEDSGVNTLSGTDITMDFGMSVINAETGEIIFHNGASSDTGRGMMANVGSGGFYQIIGASNAGNFQSNGGSDFTSISNGMSSNFRIFWDGDLYDELLDGTTVTSWNGRNMPSIFTADGCVSINGTKSNPALQADLFGDWREELVYPTTAGTALRVFTTTTPTEYKIKTLMQDPVYRSGVAAEQTAYNQPPHVGFYMGEEMFAADITNIEIISEPSKSLYDRGEELNTAGLAVQVNYEDGASNTLNAYAISGYDPEQLGEQTVTVTYLNNTAGFKVTVTDIESIEVVSPPDNTFFYPGDSIDTTGLVVNAHYAGIEDAVTITDYEISGYNPSTIGEQAVTVTYRGKTADFNVEVAGVDGISITSFPSSTNLYTGSKLNTAGLVVTATYSDGNSRTVTDYEISGYDSYKTGTQTVTISYFGKTAEFEVTVIHADISNINGTYETTQSSTDEIPIGSYSDSFILEHTVTINSMPANGNPNKDNTSGFFMRFNPADGTGAGWYLTTSSGGRPGQGNTSSNTPNVVWKSTNTQQITTTGLTVGETYTFTYEFSHVADGTGALVTLTITNADGTVVGSGSDLNLRNMSNNSQVASPLALVQIYNQAKSDSTASVTIGDAVIYAGNEIISVDDESATVYLSSSDTNLYAAKYDDDGLLTDIEILTPQTGKSTIPLSFTPDKLFLWTNMYPCDMWERIVQPEFDIAITVTDSMETPVPNATVTLSEIQNSSGDEDEDTETQISLSSTLSESTDKNGTAYFSNLSAGKYRALVSYSNWSIKTSSIVFNDQPVTQTVKLTGTLDTD